MRAAIYLRVSTEEQAREGLSLEAQETQCRKRAGELGATEIAVHCDPGYSGRQWDRPGLQALLADLPACQLIVAWSLDRLSRRLADLARILEQIDDLGVALVLVNEPSDRTTSAGKLQANILGSMAQFWADRTSESVKFVQRQRVENGLFPGKLPLGYVPGGHQQPAVVDEGAAEFVRQLYRRWNRGTSLHELRRWADTERPHPDGRLWAFASIRHLLRNIVYTGKVTYRGQVHDGRHEPIISARVFARAQERFQRWDGVHPRSRGTTFASILKCGECGGRVTAMGSIRQGRASYACHRQGQLPSAERGHSSYAPRRTVDVIIWEVMRRMLADWQPDAADHSDEARALRERQAALQQQLTATVAELMQVGVGKAIIDAGTEDAVRELDRVGVRIEQLGRAQRQRAEVEQAQSRGLPEAATMTRKTDLANLLFERIELHREGRESWLTFVAHDGKAEYSHPIKLWWRPSHGLAALGFTT